MQYASANAGLRMGISGAFLHMFSTYPRERLPVDLQQFRKANGSIVKLRLK